MGYYIFSYGIDTAKVKQALGSKDEESFYAVQNTRAFKNYSGQETAVNTTKIALHDLVFSKNYGQIARHTYWYALITICDYLGTKFTTTHEIKLGYETDLINQYLEQDFHIKLIIEESLLTGAPPFTIPPPEDFPMIGFLTRSVLTGLAAKFKNIDISDEQLATLQEEDEEKEMAYDSIRHIKANIDYCLANNLELISFCH